MRSASRCSRRERYASAFEPGCSIGVLTAQLAPRCDRLLACDVAAAAVESARPPGRRDCPASGSSAGHPGRVAAGRRST